MNKNREINLSLIIIIMMIVVVSGCYPQKKITK